MGLNPVASSLIDGASGEAWRTRLATHPSQPRAERAGSHEADGLPYLYRK